MAKILIVEDDPVIRAAYKQVLESNGHSVTEAEDGAKGLAAAKSVGPDLILLDILLPHLSGLEFLRKYRTEVEVPAEVLVLTNVDLQATADEAMALGAKDFLPKSKFSMKELAEVIDKYLTGTNE